MQARTETMKEWNKRIRTCSTGVHMSVWDTAFIRIDDQSIRKHGQDVKLSNCSRKVFRIKPISEVLKCQKTEFT